jgi:predicted metal-dependent phosphoesterase TrpH
MNLIDMHVHSKNSDGSETIENIFKSAKAMQLDLICIADHDTIQGCNEAMKLSKALCIKTIPAIEITTIITGKKPVPVHILGYGIDLRIKEAVSILNKALKINWDFYNHIAQDMLEQYIKMQLLDKSVTLKDIIEHAGSISPAVHRWHLMYYRSYCAGIPVSEAKKEASELGLLNLPNIEIVRPIEAVELIHGLGGVAVLAHPGEFVTMSDENTLLKLLEKLKENGLYGIEAYTYKHNSLQVMHFKELAVKFDLKITAGSDYHGFFENSSLGIHGITTKEFDEFMKGL